MDSELNKNKWSFFKNKKLVFLIVIILIIIISVLFVLLTNRGPISDNSTAPRQESEVLAAINFESPAVVGAAGNPITSDILVNTGGEPITSVVISIKFDPSVVTDVRLDQFRDPESALSNTFENAPGEVDSTQGIAWITLNFPENVPPQAGSGAVAQLTFTTNSNTTLSFTQNSALLSRLSEKPIPANFPPLNVRTATFAPDAQERLLQQQELLRQNSN